ncbi:integrase-like protein [Kribbella sp. VKM Ac-2571]|uniref:tyrosine-type recombinase/integrase n=1 Tax=Kribbella sp. VKM Ac-2571 TaxID=2512222 RepID=UPI001060A412|nr:site-specific integrase [Kribbella sp. VKM Ac-2571]TDO55568.1 integrase-like protein [Kribbella sp. VKM Ac-2571]
MAYVKDLWTRAVKQADGTTARVRNERWGKGKRWLAGWVDPEGRGRTKAFGTKGPAERHANAMETDRERGEYIDPEAGKVRFGEVAERWLASRVVDPASTIRYESSLRLHVDPVFGRRQLRTIKPSEIAAWIADLDARFGPSTARTAYLVLHGTLEIAVDDEAIKKNPAKGRAVKVPAEKSGRTVAWSDDVVLRIVEGHAPEYRPIASVGAACGLRQGELFGLAEEDIDFEEMVIHVRRQVKKLGREFVFALPKNDTERTVPMSGGTALILKEHIKANRPRPYTLPWEKTDGEPRTVKLLFRWTDDKHIRARTYDELVWKPALFYAGVIAEPTTDRRGRRQYVSSRENGMHALRHYFASITLADGVNIKELAEYLGHSNPGFTLRLYTHMLPSSHERARKAVDSRLARLFSLKSHGAVTEQAAVRSPTTSWEPDGGLHLDDPGIGL